jgi:hypothetical protein
MLLGCGRQLIVRRTMAGWQRCVLVVAGMGLGVAVLSGCEGASTRGATTASTVAVQPRVAEDVCDALDSTRVTAAAAELLRQSAGSLRVSECVADETTGTIANKVWTGPDGARVSASVVSNQLAREARERQLGIGYGTFEETYDGAKTERCALLAAGSERRCVFKPNEGTIAIDMGDVFALVWESNEKSNPASVVIADQAQFRTFAADVVNTIR